MQKTVYRIHTLHSHAQSCVCWCMRVSVYLCVSVLIKQKSNWCAGIKCKMYSMYVGKSKRSEGKVIAFLWHAEILVASR